VLRETTSRGLCGLAAHGVWLEPSRQKKISSKKNLFRQPLSTGLGPWLARMFHDMMMLKLQVMNGQHAHHMQELFHSHWPGADVVPINGLRLPCVLLNSCAFSASVSAVRAAARR
jgi:hypothetical protein